MPTESKEFRLYLLTSAQFQKPAPRDPALQFRFLLQPKQEKGGGEGIKKRTMRSVPSRRAVLTSQFKKGFPQAEAFHQLAQSIRFQPLVKAPVKAKGVNPGAPFLGHALIATPIRNRGRQRPGVFQEAVLRMAVVGGKNAPSAQGDKKTVTLRKESFNPGLPDTYPMHRPVALRNPPRWSA